MRAELPWNVAGIPPEAREAARAAARREGLSVGEWLTRRIIAELGEVSADIPTSTGVQGPDFVSATNRRETEAMLARLADAEAEASDTYRRIEEQLRSVGSGLDNAERSQSEMSRAMSRAATEITLASNEQAQAFDQLGRHMAGMDDRLEKLERAAVQDGLKEAVKGLHQGLSRLADQFGQATARSGGQVGSLARNLEQLALRLVQARADAEAAAQALDAHIGQVEETQAFTNGTIEQMLGRMETQAETHHQDLTDLRRRGGSHEEALTRIEDRLAVLEEPDVAMEERLQAIEQVLETIRQELAEPDPHAGLDEALRQVSLRLDLAEQNHSDMLAELRTGLARIPEPAIEPAPVVPEPDAIVEEEPIVLAESLPVLEAIAPEQTYEPFAEEMPAPAVAAQDSKPDNFVQHAFANHFEMPQDFADALARPAAANDAPVKNESAKNAPVHDVSIEEQDFLESMRRTAREAAEADARGIPAWTRSLGSERKRPTFLVVLAVVFSLLLAAAAILMLSQGSAAIPEKHLPKHLVHTSGLVFVPRLQTAKPHAAKSPIIPVVQKSEPAPVVRAAPAMDKLLAAANGGNDAAETIVGFKNLDAGDSVAAFEWLEKAALQGQPVAEYRLATLYERGQGVAADPMQALKWYVAAANQGNRKAMYNLAVAYAEGTVGPKNTQEAAHWFAQAAALGLSDSQFNLAVLYERGDGVPQSLSEAYKWYSIAAAAGDTESKARIALLQTQLPAADRQAAERAAQNFRPQTPNRIANNLPPPGDIGG